jgi:transcriptional regulator with XRE-family HTH domain
VLPFLRRSTAVLEEAPSVRKLSRLKEVRERKALSQRDLAQLAGVSPDTIRRLESRGDTANHVTVRKLAAALNVEPHELMEPEA